MRLSIGYDESNLGLGITVVPATIDGFAGFADPSLPMPPIQNFTIKTSNGTLDTSTTATPGIVTDGSLPVLGDDKNLPDHGQFGPGTVWQEYNLGDFDKTDSPIGDFIGQFPTDITPSAGQINVYEISVTGGSGATLHFDAYDHIQAKNNARAIFAPFSHDADGDSNIAPEPLSLAVWLGLISIGLIVLPKR